MRIGLKYILSRIIGFCLSALVVFSPNIASAKESSWLKITEASQRYQTLSNFGGAAVLDRETGLIWEQCPSTTLMSWDQAVGECYLKNIGDRMGWRMATYEEMTSIGDRSKTPWLPNSGAFCATTVPRICTDPRDVCYDTWFWTSTKEPVGGGVRVVVGGRILNATTSGGTAMVWCVRGGQ